MTMSAATSPPPQSFFFQRDGSCYLHLEEQKLPSEQKLESLSLPSSQMEVTRSALCSVDSLADQKPAICINFF